LLPVSLRCRDAVSPSCVLSFVITQLGRQLSSGAKLAVTGSSGWQTVKLPWHLRKAQTCTVHLQIADAVGNVSYRTLVATLRK
jgi:hypothetical protein